MKYNWSDVIDYNNSSSRLWETTKVTVGWLLLVGGCAFPCVTIHHLCPSLHHPFLHPPSILKLHSLDDPDNYLDHPHLDDYLDHLNHPYQLDDLIIYYQSRLMDLFKLLHGFVKDVLCISRPLPIGLLLAWVWKAGADLECFNFSLTQSQSRDQTLKSLFKLHRRFFKSGLWWFSSFFSHTPLCARKKCEVRKISFSLRSEKDIQFFEKWENSWSPSFSLTWRKSRSVIYLFLCQREEISLWEREKGVVKG